MQKGIATNYIGLVNEQMQPGLVFTHNKINLTKIKEKGKKYLGHKSGNIYCCKMV